MGANTLNGVICVQFVWCDHCPPTNTLPHKWRLVEDYCRQLSAHCLSTAMPTILVCLSTLVHYSCTIEYLIDSIANRMGILSKRCDTRQQSHTSQVSNDDDKDSIQGKQTSDPLYEIWPNQELTMRQDNVYRQGVAFSPIQIGIFCFGLENLN